MSQPIAPPLDTELMPRIALARPTSRLPVVVERQRADRAVAEDVAARARAPTCRRRPSTCRCRRRPRSRPRRSARRCRRRPCCRVGSPGSTSSAPIAFVPNEPDMNFQWPCRAVDAPCRRPRHRRPRRRGRASTCCRSCSRRSPAPSRGPTPCRACRRPGTDRARPDTSPACGPIDCHAPFLPPFLLSALNVDAEFDCAEAGIDVAPGRRALPPARPHRSTPVLRSRCLRDP